MFKKHPEILGIYYPNPVGMSSHPEHKSDLFRQQREIFSNYKQKYFESMRAES